MLPESKTPKLFESQTFGMTSEQFIEKHQERANELRGIMRKEDALLHILQLPKTFISSIIQEKALIVPIKNKGADFNVIRDPFLVLAAIENHIPEYRESLKKAQIKILAESLELEKLSKKLSFKPG